MFSDRVVLDDGREYRFVPPPPYAPEGTGWLCYRGGELVGELPVRFGESGPEFEARALRFLATGALANTRSPHIIRHPT